MIDVPELMAALVAAESRIRELEAERDAYREAFEAARDIIRSVPDYDRYARAVQAVVAAKKGGTT